jgi:zinc ribbon protein
MFCPRCAAQNLDDAKFCRGCGMNLETVALALADNYHPGKSGLAKDPFESWLETRGRPVNKISKGMGWLVSSLLIGAALGLFSNTHDWIIIWMCMGGWMAVLGVISIVTGTAALMESRFTRHQLDEASHVTSALFQPVTANESAMNEATTAPILRPQSSVTEHTTTRLIKP